MKSITLSKYRLLWLVYYEDRKKAFYWPNTTDTLAQYFTEANRTVIIFSRLYIYTFAKQRNISHTIRKNMLDYLSTLPVELIYKILDNIPLLDILTSICCVNKRLRSVSLAYPRCLLNFSGKSTSINKSQFDSICAYLQNLTSQIVSLTLFDEDDVMTSVKNALFFSRFSIIDKTFPNLLSLTLTYIEYDSWCLFKNRLPSLIVSLSIYLYYSGKVHVFFLTRKMYYILFSDLFCSCVNKVPIDIVSTECCFFSFLHFGYLLTNIFRLQNHMA